MSGRARVAAWFARRGWSAFPFQERAWSAYAGGASGLVHAPTGTGKTLAVLLGPLIEAIDAGDDGGGARLIWLTPLRALAVDTARAIADAIAGLGLAWTVELRTGDAPAALRARQRTRLPSILVTTPESLSVLLSHADAVDRLSTLRAAVVDEWHELIGTKRGVQTELGLARLRRWNPGLRTWGLSATLANLDQAADVLIAGPAALVHADNDKQYVVETLLPDAVERFPWAGHLGLKLMPKVLDTIERARTTLLFTNVRSQAELWFSAIAATRPALEPVIALHHGSLDRSLREHAEAGLRDGSLRLVVCTSSLDLGVDFPAVDQVIQVGSPKGVGRLLQRAGRSGHRPGEVSRIVGVPTNAFELVEFAAARDAIDRRAVEAREPLTLALDVLAQHLVTIAAGGGFIEAELLAEVRATHAFRVLSDAAWLWTMDFVRRGGPSLTAYPRFARVLEQDGRWRVVDQRLARDHRLAIGTITADQSVAVKYLTGGALGHVEESFIARLRPGDRFAFAGRTLQLVRVRDDAAWVRRATGRPDVVPQWMGGRLPLSSRLADAVLARLDSAVTGVFAGPEMTAAQPILELQSQRSLLPRPGHLLIEHAAFDGGFQTTLFPFAGRLVHEGLGSLIAWRLTRMAPRSVSVVVTDYGIGLIGPTPLPADEATWRAALSHDDLLEDLDACLAGSALARRRFRDIARIAGLVHPGFPGAAKRGRHLQASASLYFDVFAAHDPGNLLLAQAQREVLDSQLEIRRLRAALERIAVARFDLVDTRRISPLAFPLWAEFSHAEVSSEPWAQRVARMALALERDEPEQAPARQPVGRGRAARGDARARRRVSRA
ncbi:MAG TPA: ligase-associated DNA damage response DEXH box helicase [Planctomycetota bacterium]|nr:ligase-associated DNA damage response DEXH box helicase [Planctomycetota bacterium]